MATSANIKLEGVKIEGQGSAAFNLGGGRGREDRRSLRPSTSINAGGLDVMLRN